MMATRTLPGTGLTVLAVMLLIPVLPLTGTTTAGAPDGPVAVHAQPSDAPLAPAGLWLSGPFGRVRGGPPSHPATAPPLGLSLDAFVRGAPLAVDAGLDGPRIEALEVIALSVAEPAADETLSRGALRFAGPTRVGPAMLIARATLEDGEAAVGTWSVDVPDRPPPEDGLFDIPAPDVVLGAASGEVAGAPGSGCYAYLCVEAGRKPPPGTLEPLSIAIGETPRIRLSDRSALLEWEGSLEPIGDEGREALVAGETLGEDLAQMVSLEGLAPPASGEWLLDLEVVFDRERGWLRTAYRLVAE